ncbi:MULTISPECIES: NAD(P)H-dependent oxidoreductase [Chitinophagaceae]
MRKVFIINGGQTFAHSGGKFNTAVTDWTKSTLLENNLEVKVTNINDDFDPMMEVEHFKWADIIVYHFPIWWFQVPNRLKRYIDEVFTAGHNNGIYKSDGRSRSNPAINYGTGGLMQGKKYFVTTSWNAPETAFTLENEFFDQHSVDEGILFGFHKMNQFAGLENIGSFHFHDMEKGATKERIDHYRQLYISYLQETFALTRV